ncbi:MAG: hypothetical protein A2077_06490 [Nitrospirae bacterium GWC2_46_6]|nr:MAG: hypothetical protein A2077_06490 [Nitrospirae bacterium GWC2_46_6]OGW20248.1 MAG: hypothetical protein A2Z82_02620 [Nitrospirae bacterium GWA2_46_11]OGW23125.1 MAG: hypothetical protein A2X55_09120 [Nitrospirae bacterium GWB2_47_37]
MIVVYIQIEVLIQDDSIDENGFHGAGDGIRTRDLQLGKLFKLVNTATYRSIYYCFSSIYSFLILIYF